MRVNGEIEGDVCNDAKRSVTADRAKEQIGVFDWRRGGDATVGEDERDRAHGADERTLTDVAAVRVHGKRTTDRKGVIRLHDLHSEPGAVDRLLHLAPTRA